MSLSIASLDSRLVYPGYYGEKAMNESLYLTSLLFCLMCLLSERVYGPTEMWNSVIYFICFVIASNVLFRQCDVSVFSC